MRNLVVKNLDRYIDNTALRDMFDLLGNVLACEVACDSNGRSRGYGVVHYETEEAAKQAIEYMNGMQIGEHTVEVSAFAERQPWETIQQTFAYIAGDETKQQHLSDIMLHLRNNGSFTEGKKVLVFCNRADDVRKVVDDLHAENLGININGIPKTYAQHDRDDVLQLLDSLKTESKK